MYDVMIVEDEVRIRAGLKKNIPWESIGFRVSADADNGNEALQKFKILKPHVILTDIRMHDMDGLTLMKHVRTCCGRTRFVVLSGYSDFEYARESIQYGASAYLLKPTKTFEIKETFLKIKYEMDHQSEGLSDSMRLAHPNVDEGTGLKGIIHFLEKNYSEKISLTDAAEKAYMSPTYFSKHFKQQIGMTFIEYVTDLRLKRAKHLLETTRYKIIDISILVGYDDFRHFCKTFKMKEGLSPKEYREEMVDKGQSK